MNRKKRNRIVDKKPYCFRSMRLLDEDVIRVDECIAILEKEVGVTCRIGQIARMGIKYFHTALHDKNFIESLRSKKQC